RLVSRSERARNLNGHIKRFTQMHWKTLTQRLALDELAGDVMNRVVLADLVNGHYVRMIERDDGVRFLFKALEALGVTGKAQRQQFERGSSTRDNVGGQIDFAHPPCTDRFRNLVVADSLANK